MAATKTKKKAKTQSPSPIRVKALHDEKTYTTLIKINGKVDVGVIQIEAEPAVFDNYLSFWVAGREVRLGPLTPEQAEKLSEDLGYAAVA